MGDYKFFDNGLKCTCCGKVRKRMFRISKSDGWSCARCWRHCSMMKCQFRK